MTDSPLQRLAPQSHTPLRGKTVLITRAAEQASEVVKLLEQLGATVILFPTIQIVPPKSWKECDYAIAKIAEYDSIVLTSVNAAEHFFSRVHLVANGAENAIAEKTVFAVGEKTRHAAEQFGIPFAAMPEVYDAKHLAIALARTDVRGKRFLFPKGNLASNVISFALLEHGASVDEVIVYETVQPPAENIDTVRRMFEHKEIDIVTFFSPSSVSNFLATIPGELLTDAVIAVIGQTTAAAARNLSVPVHIVAEHATSAYLVTSIVRYYE